MVQIKLLHLLLSDGDKRLYIPYGSDKTLSYWVETGTINTSLYPIWFR